jgi:hypothetical protein
MKRLLLTVAALCLCVLASAPGAAAKAYEDFRSEVKALTPAVSGLELKVVRGDEALSLVNKSGRTVVVEGYDGEQYLRFHQDGTVEANRRSAATYINADRYGLQRVPDNALPGAKPRWKKVGRGGSYTWFDHRIHLTARKPPARFTRQKRVTKVLDWQVPMQVDGKPVRATGTLYWDPGKSAGGFPTRTVIAVVAALLAIACLLLLWKGRLPLPRRSGATKKAADEAW